MNIKTLKLLSLPALCALTLAGCKDNKANNMFTGITGSDKVVVTKQVKPIRTDVVVADKHYNSKKDPVIAKAKLISGTWKMKVGDEDPCQLITSQTKYGKNFRAATHSCPEDFKNIRSWRVENEKLNLFDKQGKLIIALDRKKSEDENVTDPAGYKKPIVLSFEGETKDGKKVELTR